MPWEGDFDNLIEGNDIVRNGMRGAVDDDLVLFGLSHSGILCQLLFGKRDAGDRRNYDTPTQNNNKAMNVWILLS